MMEHVTKKFLRYVKIHTTSDPSKQTTPSTTEQFNLATLLANELNVLGMKNVKVDKHAYVTATLPSNTSEKIPTIGFIAHMDTSPDFSGKDVNPQIINKYNGSEIILNKTENIVLHPNNFPELLNYKGQDIICTDGTTLLGADDKAGIAEIMCAMEYLINNPKIKHGDIKICFTPDEEIGRGADLFDIETFNADFAYTIDGGEIGELEYENFNAAMASITINGLNVHPGYAKNKMLNSMSIACELNSLIPPSEVPEHTKGYEGFYHLIEIQGNVEKTELKYIIRDFDEINYGKRKEKISQIVNIIQNKYPNAKIELNLIDQYFNMHHKIKPVMHIIDLAKKAMEQAQVKPLIKPIRGGTDGARLSFMGLPTPNIFAGGHNFHGRYEFIPIQSMEKAVEVIINIIILTTTKASNNN
ncbi:MAG: peptidase T [Marinilabiliaceae bacterium]|nr:peptidase T [Marinilabiliaceae bacterium]